MGHGGIGRAGNGMVEVIRHWSAANFGMVTSVVVVRTRGGQRVSRALHLHVGSQHVIPLLLCYLTTPYALGLHDVRGFCHAHGRELL